MCSWDGGAVLGTKEAGGASTDIVRVGRVGEAELWGGTLLRRGGENLGVVGEDDKRQKSWLHYHQAVPAN